MMGECVDLKRERVG